MGERSGVEPSRRRARVRAGVAVTGCVWALFAGMQGCVFIDDYGRFRVADDGSVADAGDGDGGDASPPDAGSLEDAAGDTGPACSPACRADEVCEGSPARCAFDSITRLTVANDWACVVRRSGAADCWGSNDQGELGAGNFGRASSMPRRIALAGVTELQGGNSHACALTLDGGVYCWGQPTYALGLGPTPPATPGWGVVTPARVDFMPSPDRPRLIAVGDASTCAIAGLRRLWCWGQNGLGQLARPPPELPTSDVPVAAAETWLPRDEVQALDVGYDSACAVAQDASLWCWGSNGFGQLGQTGGDAPASSHVALNYLGGRYTQVSVGGGTACVIDETGVVTCFGRNESGQVGSGATARTGSPTRVSLPGRAIAVAVGHAHACATVADAGTSTTDVYCWGGNDEAQCGTPLATNPVLLPSKVPNTTGARLLGASARNACVVVETGERDDVRCWGANGHGQLGVPYGSGGIERSAMPLSVTF
jgi:alpha-tubulin suppressor-like RCC1 family protein